jgi:hypothetical protein
VGETVPLGKGDAPVRFQVLVGGGGACKMALRRDIRAQERLVDMPRNARKTMLLRLTLIWLVVLVLTAGCSKSNDSGAVGKAATGASLRAVTELEAPASVLVYGGSTDLKRFLTDVHAFASKVSPAVPPFADMAAGTLQKELNLSDPGGIDLGKPARFALLDPKKYAANPLSLLVATTGKDKLTATLPASKKENDAGNALGYQDASGKTIYLNFIGDLAVFTGDKDAFSAHREFFEKLAAATLPNDRALIVSARNASALFGAEMDGAFAQMKQQMAAAAAANPSASPEGVTKIVDGLASTAKELDKILVTIALPEDGAVLSISLYPRPDTELEKSFKTIGSRPPSLLGRYPADTPFFLSMNINPDAMGPLTEKMVAWSLSIGLGGVQTPPQYLEAMKEYWKATNGEFVMAAHRVPGTEGLSLSALMSVRDAAKVREGMRKGREMYNDPTIAALYKKAGMEAQIKNDAYKIGEMPVDTMAVKMNTPSAQLGPVAPFLAELMQTHMLVDRDLSIVAYGEGGKSTLEAFLGGKIVGGLDKASGVQRALKYAAPGQFMFMYAAPIELVKGVSMGGKNPMAAQLASRTTTTGVAISANSKDGVVTLVLDLPAEQAVGVAQLAGMTRGAF